MTQAHRRYRILSIDGGGIYGLVSVLWLRKLCEQDEKFLSGNDIHLFAGISAGAITAALLAQHERPREALLSGALERFWAEQIGMFSNTVDPVQAWLSLWGIGGWFGEADFRQQLKAVFQDQTLADLKQPVFLSTFNWLGTHASEQQPVSPGPWSPFNTALHSSWQPCFFSNVGPSANRTASVADVVYGAASPAGLRAIRQGLSDAGLFAVSPSVNALASILHLCGHIERRSSHTSSQLLKKITTIRNRLNKLSTATPTDQLWAQMDTLKGKADKARRQAARVKRSESPLRGVTMLSVGNGSQTPSFWLPDFNLSLQQLSFVPTNPFQGQFSPPFTSVTFGGLTGDENLICRELLGSRYHRLQAGLMAMPVIPATVASRNPFVRQCFEQWIYSAQDTLASQDAVREALRFIASPDWRSA